MNYEIYKQEPVYDDNNKLTNVFVTYKIIDANTGNTIYKRMGFNNYKKYGKPSSQHMVEPDGSVIVCSDMFSVNFRTMTDNVPTWCDKHNKPMGCKFHLGTTDSFTNRTKKDLDHCRCYCRPATQYDFDKWCYFDKKNKNKPLCDNGKIYKKLISPSLST